MACAGAHPCHFCTATGLTPPTSALGLGLTPPCHICTGGQDWDSSPAGMRRSAARWRDCAAVVMRRTTSCALSRATARDGPTPRGDPRHREVRARCAGVRVQRRPHATHAAWGARHVPLQHARLTVEPRYVEFKARLRCRMLSRISSSDRGGGSGPFDADHAHPEVLKTMGNLGVAYAPDRIIIIIMITHQLSYFRLHGLSQAGETGGPARSEACW